MASPSPRQSPYVSLSIQCSLLDGIGARRHPFSLITASSTLQRGRRGLAFTCPPLLVGGEREGSTGQPQVRVEDVNRSGYTLFAPVGGGPAECESTPNPASLVVGSGWGSALASAAHHLGGAVLGEGAGEEELAGLVRGSTERGSRGGEAAAVPEPLRSPQRPRRLPTALLRRALRRVLVGLQLPGRSPSVSFALLPCEPVPRDGGGVSGEVELVRFLVRPTAAATAGHAGWVCALTTAQGAGVGKRARAAASEEGDAGAGVSEGERSPANLVPAAALAVRCDGGLCDSTEGTGGMGRVTWVQLDTTAACMDERSDDPHAFLTRLYVEPGSAPAMVASARARVGVAASTVERQTRVERDLLMTLLRYTPADVVGGVSGREALDAAPNAASLDGFLQRRCFLLLSLLAHRAWCAAVARELCARQRTASSGEGTGAVAIVSADATTLARAAVPGAAMASFTSVVVMARADEPGVGGAHEGEVAVVVRVTGASEPLHWRVCRRAGHEEWSVEKEGTLHNLAAELFA